MIFAARFMSRQPVFFACRIALIKRGFGILAISTRAPQDSMNMLFNQASAAGLPQSMSALRQRLADFPKARTQMMKDFFKISDVNRLRGVTTLGEYA